MDCFDSIRVFRFFIKLNTTNVEYLHIKKKRYSAFFSAMVTFKDILTIKRKEKGVNQDELATFLGISRATLSDYERGKTEPNFSTLIQIAKFFGTTTDELLGQIPTTTGPDSGPATTDVIKLLEEKAKLEERVQYMARMEKDVRDLIDLKNELIQMLKNKIESLEEEIRELKGR